MVARYEENQHALVEAYKSMRTSIIVDKNIKTILVTSSEMSEGKTTTVSNLAKCFAELDKFKILLIDCDFRRPSIHKHFSMENSPGVVDLITNDESFEETIRYQEDLHILTCGKRPDHPAEILESDKMRNFINSMKDKYDYIFIDSPPISRANDACIIAKYADGTIIVSASNEVDIELAKITKSRLENVNANIMGVILNKFKLSDEKHYQHYMYGDDVKRKKGIFRKRR